MIALAEVLTQQQIDELLGNLHSGEVAIEEITENSNKKIREYDFRSPKKFTREQLKILDNIFDSFTRFFGLQLSSLLRTACQMEIIQVEEEEYREFNNALNDSVLVGIIDLASEEFSIHEKQILVELARPISFSVLDLLLGGDGSGHNVEREYTDIEISIMEYVLKIIAQQIQNAWSNYAEITHTLSMIETNSRLIQAIAPDETVVIVVIRIEIKGLSGTMNVCLPASALDVLFKVFDAKFAKALRKEDAGREANRKDNIMGTLKKSSLTMTGILGSTNIELQELLGLQKGDILMLDNAVKEDSIVVNVEGVPWFKGTMGVSKKNYAIKVGQVQNVSKEESFFGME